MSIDPVWLAGFQKRMSDARLAIDDWVECMELEELLEEPFEEDS